VLSAFLKERRYSRGEVIFRRGGPGDAMYVLLQGQIGIWLPGEKGADEPGRGRRRVIGEAQA